MSTHAEAQKKQTKRKRPSKGKSSTDETSPKRYKVDNVSTLREPPTSKAVNGDKLSPQENETSKSHDEPGSNYTAHLGELKGQKRKRGSVVDGQKIKGHSPEAIHEQDKPTNQTKSPPHVKAQIPELDDSPSATVVPVNGFGVPQTQTAGLEKYTSPRIGVDTHPDQLVNIAKKGKRRKRQKTSNSLAVIPRQTPLWSITEPVGGHFIHLDPLFSPDERYIIIGHRRAIFIYSVSTSLLVRTLPVDKSEVTSFALSTAKTDNIYVATKEGMILLWNWVTGNKVGQWKLRSQIAGLWTTVEPSADEDTVFTIDKGGDDVKDTVTAHKLSYGQDTEEATSILLFEPRQHLQGLKILSHGEIVIAFSRQSISLGQLSINRNQASEQRTYIWREFDCANEISSFDARIISKRKSKANDHEITKNTVVDVVIGTMRGAIFVYSDLLNKLASHTQPKERDPTQSILNPRRYHWHREAVGTVKWSKDGNYLVSGGRETVIVLWQLETSKQQFLPHLTSDIESLVVSPSGAAYAVRLLDNSLMILSTSELKPKTHIAGIQAQNFIHEDARPQVPLTLKALYNTSKDPVDSISSTPAAFSPQGANQLLLVVPSSQPTNRPPSQKLSASYLQTFNVTTSNHISRQALTRNNATNFNKGPEWNKLDDPNVKLMCLSCDGKWLATVDEWIPPIVDTDFLAAGFWTARVEQLRRRETYLKFWTWSDKKESWMLETRVDIPHTSSDGMSAGRVEHLASNPDRIGFATVGEDGIVRIWTPKTTFRNNRVIRGVRKGGVVNWSCQSSTRLEDPQKRRHVLYDRGHPSVLSTTRLAYSPDGSVLAACQSSQDTPGGSLLQLIDTSSGDVAYTRTVPAQDLVLGIGFLDKHIIILSDQLVVWDPVEDALTFGYDLDLSHLTSLQKQQLCHIATSPSDGTFALALSQVPSLPAYRASGKLEGKIACSILVFSPTDPQPLFTARIPQLATALIPGPQSRGYAIIDSRAEIRMVSSSAAFSVPLVKPLAGANESLAEMQDELEQQTGDPLRRLLGEEEESKKSAGGLVPAASHPSMVDVDVDDDAERGDPVVRSEKLAEILDTGGSSSSLPPVQDMFNAVVRLFAQKSRTAQETDASQ